MRERFFCHCESCRRCAGASPVPWVTVATSAFTVLRGFCAGCGTPLAYRHGSTPQEMDVVTLSFDDPGPLAPQYHLWVGDQLPWIVIADALPRYAATREQAQPR